MPFRKSNCSHVSEAGQENVNASSNSTFGSTYEVVRHRALCDIGNKIVPRGEINKKVVPQGMEGKLNIQEVEKKPVIWKPPKLVSRVKPSVSKVNKKPESNEKSSITTCLPSEANFKFENGSYSSQFLNDVDIDKQDGNDEMLVSNYVCDIYAYLRELEVKQPVRPNYLLGQRLTGSMRAVLVDWLVDVNVQFRFQQETLFIAVAIVDRFLQKIISVNRKNLQLVGVAAMSLACKYEEMFTPYLTDFVYLCDDAYSQKEIVRMEYCVLRCLEYSFGRPVAPHFLRRLSKAANSEAVVHSMAKYFMEMSLVEYGMCHYSPSKIAAAALFLALWLFGNEDKAVWTTTLIYHSTYAYSDIAPVVRKMAVAIVNADTSKYQAAYKKYSKNIFLRVSVRPELKSPGLKMLMK